MLKFFSSSTFRSTASQLCGVFPYYCLKFAYGSTIGFQIILLAELYKDSSQIRMSIDQLTSLAGVTVLTPIGILSVGLLAQRLGSRTTALTCSTLHVLSALLYYHSTDARAIFAAQMLSKLTGTNALADPHISEVSEPRRRSALLVIAHLCASLGTLFVMLLDGLVNWRGIALANLALPIAAALTVLVTPNSPTWLASKGRTEEAEKALCWLRGWVRPTKVQTEFRALVDSAESSKSNSKERELGWRERSRACSQLFSQRSFVRPLSTICAMLLIRDLEGVSVIRSYSKIVFRKIDSPLDASRAMVVVEATRILGNFTTLLVLRRTGKRKLLLLTVVVVALCHSSVAIVGLLRLQNGCLWIPLIAVIVANFASAVGAETILFVLLSEIFPSSLRYVGAAIGSSFDSVVDALVCKSFLYAVQAMTLPGTFLFFTSMSVVGLFAYYLFIPETEGRSLSEIEDYFKDKKKCARRDEF